jgi:Domain of unknown function (DUF4124)
MKRILICTALLVCSGICSAAVYKWVDAQGKIQYGDRPPDGVSAELVPMLVSHPNAQRSETPRAATAPSSTPSSQPPAKAEEKKAVQEDVEAAQAKQCTEAQDRYKKDIEGRRMYKLNADGERVYLSSEEIDAERLAAKQLLDSVCNDAN